MKRILSILLIFVMLIGMLPITAQATENGKTAENLWNGRSAVFVGDSITAGAGTTKLYYQFLEEALGFGSVTAMGVNGSCISASSDYGQKNQPLINRYQDIPSADLIVIFMGTNDYGHETPLGSASDTQDVTFYGALNTIIPTLVEKHTSSKIVFATSIHRYGYGTSGILGTKFTYDNMPNGVGATLEDYVDAIKTVCAKNGVSVIDLHTECMLDPSDVEVRSEYMPDGIHPNAAGHEIIAGIMESHIREYEPIEKEPIHLAELIYGNKFASGYNQMYRASSRINYYLKAGTIITLKDPTVMQWACAMTSDEYSCNNLGYFPEKQWTDQETAVVAEAGWVGFAFKYRDETQSFDLTKPLSDYITIEEPHTHTYEATITELTCTEQGYTTYTCSCGDSYKDDYVDAAGHTYENGICTACGAAQWDTDGDGALEILAIGNSFSVDALEYAYQLAQDLGIEEITIGNLYIGGCSLATHAANAAGDLRKYTYYYNDNGTWKTTSNYKISTALESRSWDYVSLQQASNYSGVESTYNKDLTNLITYVKNRSEAKLVWHMTWAYQQNSTHSAFPTYNKDQTTMYNAILSAVQNKIVTNSDFDLIVPNGTAVQNSRTSLLGDTTTRDGYHMSYDYGRYLTGLLFIKTVTGLSVNDITYAPSGVDAVEKAIAIESVNNAFAKPFVVTESGHTGEAPEEGYVLLQSELYKCAYWHPLKAGCYNELIYDQSNSNQFVATIRFTRETLPVGSIIILADGWQYRPDGWVTDTLQAGTRESVTTAPYVVITEEWWGDYTIRSFNISKVGLPSLTNVAEQEVRAAFRIYVPESSHTHEYAAEITTPTCTEKGYTTNTCICGDSYVDTYVGATGHTYKNGICTSCGAEHPNLANYEGKVISILGDSISTFAGYIPVADGFNLEHLSRYPDSDRVPDVTAADQTWWMQVINELGAKLGINDSWRGATVSGAAPVTTGTTGENAAMSNLIRIQNLGANGTPNVILFYGGTNDLAHVSKVGTFDAATAPTEVDLTTRKWDNLAGAYVQTILRLRYYYPDAVIIAMLPTYTKSYYSADKLAQANAVLAQICDHYGVTYVDLRYCGITANDLPDGVHPGAAGMDYISGAVVEALLNDSEMQNGANDVHSVTHKLTGAESSLSYYKGVTHGKSFVTTITGENVTVSVIMDGVDITDIVYTNGTVTIAEVTGDIIITAEGHAKPIYEDYLEQLPEDTCSGTNLWAELEHNKQYYTVNGWGIHSSGTVYSVTFPVNVGDRIYATSFGAAGTNGSSISGIRVTWFAENGVLKSVSPDIVYDEFSANGYLTVPEGALVVSIPMWKVSDDNEIFVLNRSHSFENGICTACGEIVDGSIWQIVENGEVIGVYTDLQSAIDACETGGTVRLTANCTVSSGVKITKDITIDGGNFLVDISGCVKEFISIGKNVAVTLRDLKLDGGATGFEVDYDAVTYTDYTIPLKAGSLDNDHMAETSAILSFGKQLICENVDIYNRYTASYGAAMQIRLGSVELTDCDFTHNYGTKRGGALYIGNSFGSMAEYPVTSVTIRNCTFTENYSGHGGAISATNVAEMSITNSLFDSNTANGGKGGALDLAGQNTTKPLAKEKGLDYMQTTINGCVFANNWAGNDGFSIQSYESELYITDTKFIGNVGVHPTSSVGTVSVEHYRGEEWPLYVCLDGCLFEGNQGPCAAYGDHDSPSELDVTNCIFRGNQGNMSALLYASTSNFTDCQFVNETMATAVIDARSYSNYQTPPKMTLTDVSFADCVAPTEILTRKQDHNMELNTYTVIQQGTTNGDITIWDNNAVSILGDHTGNIQLDYDTEGSNLTIGNNATIKGITFTQPTDAEAALGEKYCVAVEAEGEDLTHQWYFCNAGSNTWYKSSVKDDTYDDVMTTTRAGREVYCVITDANGNTVTTATAKLVCLPSEELEIVTQPTNGEAALGETYCVTVEAKGEGIKYQWYFRNAGAKEFSMSSVRDNTYNDVMTTARAGREVYCVITDVSGNTVTTDTVKLIRVASETLAITKQPVNSEAKLGERYCVSVEAKGEGLKYQWYFRNTGSSTWSKSSVKDNTYDDVMTKARNGREIYCVITDALGNTVTTDVVKLIAVPKVELQLMGQSYESATMGERYCVTVNAQGEGLKYQWYFRNAGSNKWYTSSVRDNTYDDVMTKARANREVYCVITDALGNQVITNIAILAVTNS